MSAQEKESQSTALSLTISDHALVDLRRQRQDLNRFIVNELKPDVDFGKIPGTPKPSLFKPGAEKLAKIFQLGSRIVDKERVVDPSKRWAMFSYTVEVFHIPSGKVISQCEGSANSMEKKYLRQDMATILNTLQKMAQKRAYVGAMIIATGASDFFTQDVEDLDLGQARDVTPPKVVQPKRVPREMGDEVEPIAMGDYIVRFGKFKGQTLSDIGLNECLAYVGWIEGQSEKTGKPIDGAVREFVNAVRNYQEEQDGVVPF